MSVRPPSFQLGHAAPAAGESRYAAMLEAALDCIVTMDRNGLIVDFNAAAERTFGYLRDDVRGRRLSDLLIAPELRARHEAGMASYLAGREPRLIGRRLEMEAMRSDGSRIPVELTVTRSDLDGEPLFISFLRDLSGLHATRAALEQAEARYRNLVEQIPVVTYICDYDEDATMRYVSPQIEALTGYPPHRWVDDPHFWHSVLHPDDAEWVPEELARHTREEIPVDLEYRLIAADGSTVHILDQETIVRDALGKPLLSQGVLVDVTELRGTEAALRASEDQVRTIVGSAPMILFAVDAEGVFTLSIGQGLEVLGLQPGEVVGRHVEDVYADFPEILVAIRKALAGERVSEVLEVGQVVFEVTYSPTDPGAARDHAVIGVATDVTARHRSEQQLAHDAYHDRLTGLANRGNLDERLATAVVRSGTVALLNLDLDDFKTVNDSLGHAAGDELLRQLAHRLSRRVEAPHLLARHGGDEFMLLLEDVPGDGRAAAEAIASELLEELRRPFLVGGAELQVGASIGISLYPADASDAADLLKHADAAMYQAKRAGRGRHALYRACDDTAHRRLELTTRLRAALARDELELHFQPLYALASRTPVGVEALVRWNDPERGMISPAEFIPVAEDAGLIEVVGEWVTDAVCRQTRAWQDLGLDIDVTFNASPLELTRPGFARRLADRMAAHGVRPGALTMEIIESAVADPATVAPVLERVSALGVRIAIDDFGAGFSSLARLRHLTVHTLKLDRSFLRDVPGDARAGSFVTAVLGLAAQLGLTVVAEGIETAAQLDFLVAEGAELGQGFLLARPMPVGEVTELLQSCSGRGGPPSRASRQGT